MASMIEAGPIWSPAIQRLDELARRDGEEAAAFDAALREGYFSQYTSYEDPTFIGAVVDWQLALLERQGITIDHQPAHIEESIALPDRLCVDRRGRRLSADFLRNLAYIHYLDEAGLLNRSGKIIEIGGGYGAFARLLKLYCPGVTVFLVDLWPSLRFADHFLRHSFPDARILTIRPGEVLPAAILTEKECPFDFVLVCAEAADAIVVDRFALVVNIWSFGEMPDDFLDRWFDLIQKRNKVDALFSINAFLHPVQNEQADLLSLGNWLPRFDADWRIEKLEADVDIHLCPFVVNFPTGLLLMARRIGVQERDAQAQENDAAFRRVLQSDWVGIALGSRIPSDAEAFSIERRSLTALAAGTRYIAVHSLARIADGSFAALWSRHRLTGSPLAAALLAIYCRMLCRFDNDGRATREELYYVRRAENTSLAESYRRFFVAAIVLPSGDPAIEEAGQRLSIQEASDRSVAARQRADLDQAANLFFKIVERVPGHADSWFQLGQMEADRGARDRALLCFSLAIGFYPDWVNYSDALDRFAETLGPLDSDLPPADPTAAAVKVMSSRGSDNGDGVESLLYVLAALPGYSWRSDVFRLLAGLAEEQGEQYRCRAYRAMAVFVAKHPAATVLSIAHEMILRRHLASLLKMRTTH